MLWSKRHFAPTQVAEIGTDRVEFLLTQPPAQERIGAFAVQPTIVLLNGFSLPLGTWAKVLPDLARTHPVLAYNRPGIGRSSRPQRAQTVAEMSTSLMRLLAITGVGGPIVVVGHSFGGLVANYVARTHPELVSGALFLEATAPQDLPLFEEFTPGFLKLWRRLTFPGGTDHLGELNQMAAHSELFELAGEFPDVPVQVITGTRHRMAKRIPEHIRVARTAHQAQLAALSSNSQHHLSHASGHYPQLSEPELVLASVRTLLAPKTVEPQH